MFEVLDGRGSAVASNYESSYRCTEIVPSGIERGALSGAAVAEISVKEKRFSRERDRVATDVVSAAEPVINSETT